jgi:hypothetical protein
MNYGSVDGILLNKNKNTLIQCPGGKTGSYTVPNCITNIGNSAFDSCASLTSVTIPNNVTSIGEWAFDSCTGLTSVTIGNGVTSIPLQAFVGCTSLTNVMIGNGVNNIVAFAFDSCTNITGFFFQGNAPLSVNTSAFTNDNNAIVYYLPGTTGWGLTLGGLPTALWLPRVQTGDGSFGVQTNQFGFNINWASGQKVVVEACTNLANPVWSPLGTYILTNGTAYFSDSQWMNYPDRFYRIRQSQQ